MTLAVFRKILAAMQRMDVDHDLLTAEQVRLQGIRLIELARAMEEGLE